ncbi:hypothetical protein HHL21_15620 [Massilia sp. RP-1-19]|uniref:Uncharacterized protein n=1 Tax=Massilia polaris TaxID=2728846 RepID=A0A848HN95_9BURK|nr:hypothetical protein [Massilia polaris]NML62477.1 hypothetical protein [Massilia polaris]
MTPSGQIDIVAEKIGPGMTNYVMELGMLGTDTLVVATNTSVDKGILSAEPSTMRDYHVTLVTA